MEKKTIILVLVAGVLLLEIGAVISMQIHSFSTGENTRIDNLIQYNVLEGEDITSNTLFEICIKNKSYLETHPDSEFTLYLDFHEEDFFPAENFKVLGYDGRCYSGSNYKTLSFDYCNGSSIFYPKMNLYDNNKRASINFDLRSLNKLCFEIVVNYKIKNFLINNGDYKIIWFSTLCNDCKNVERFIWLDTESAVLEEWNNFDIFDRPGSKWLLLSEIKQGDSIVWYRDYKEEEQSRFFRDLALINLSISISLACVLLSSHKNFSERARNLLLFIIIFFFIAFIFFFLKI